MKTVWEYACEATGVHVISAYASGKENAKATIFVVKNEAGEEIFEFCNFEYFGVAKSYKYNKMSEEREAEILHHYVVVNATEIVNNNVVIVARPE